MTLVQGEVALDGAKLNAPQLTTDEALIALADGGHQALVNEGWSNLTEEEINHDTIRRELGKLAPADHVVIDYNVEGRQSFCTPVRGVIKAVLLNEVTGKFTDDVILHTSRAREQLDGIGGLVTHLNNLADADRKLRATPHPWQRDK